MKSFMRLILLSAIFLAAISGLITAAVFAEDSRESKQPWLTNYAEAHSLAQQTGKPLFVVFRCPH
jgi:hypothetical protein